MREVSFVVPIGTHHQQVAQVGLDHQIFEEIEGCRIRPMQIIEKKYQWMFRLGECADEAPQGDLEQSAGLLRRKIGSRRLLTNDELELGYERRHEPPMCPQCLTQSAPPDFQPDLALAHQAADQSLKGLDDRAVRNMVRVLVELARTKQA